MLKDQQYITERIRSLKSFLCIGLDPDVDKLPEVYKNSSAPVLNFCADVVDNSFEKAVAYKINIAFFESLGPDGWRQLEELVAMIPKECFIIADAKRADIGNTSAQYAKYYFERLQVDALTLHPYMGIDSLEPFLNYKNKWSVILALTSNPGSADFEKIEIKENELLFERVIQKFNSTLYADQIMYVVGATHPDYMSKIRTQAPNNFLLIPGVGEQGGDLDLTVHSLRNEREGILINVSRKILFPKGLESKIGDIKNAIQSYSDQMSKYF
ncbi:MAG: orotidine-5'-phosphate decarboxylase [Saprospiraceae bacterium]